jgi:hypothetical protein
LEHPNISPNYQVCHRRTIGTIKCWRNLFLQPSFPHSGNSALTVFFSSLPKTPVSGIRRILLSFYVCAFLATLFNVVKEVNQE